MKESERISIGRMTHANHRAQITALEAKNAKLRARIAELEAENNRMQRMIEGQMNLIAAMQDAASQVEAEPVVVYQVKSMIHPNGWYDCSKPDFDGHAKAGFPTRTLYAAQPPAPALPEGFHGCHVADVPAGINIAAPAGEKADCTHPFRFGTVEGLAAGRGTCSICGVEIGGKAVLSRCDAGTVRDAEKYRELNTPEIADFLAGVEREALHQRERWGADHDAGKAPEDWFWLLGYLGGKALHAAKSGNTEKALHHTISSSAALLNWHAAILGTHNAMRPGIDPAAIAAAQVKENDRG